MRNSLNFFASLFLAFSVAISGSVFGMILRSSSVADNGNPNILGEQDLALEVAQTQPVDFPQSTPTHVGVESTNVSIATGLADATSSFFDNIFSWKELAYKITTKPEIYFNEDAKFLKALGVDEDVDIDGDLKIGGYLHIDEDATFKDNVTIDGEKLEINGVKYFWPDSQSSGTLTSNGSGELSWASLSSGVTTFLGLQIRHRHIRGIPIIWLE